MKKYSLLFIFFLIASNCYSQESNSYDITTPFKLWLLNNESKAMSELGRDEAILTKSSTPFTILPGMNYIPKRAEDELWTKHRRIYSFINEVQKIYDLAKQFGNGKFAVTIKQARPEIWGYAHLSFVGYGLPKTIINETRRAFLNSLFIAMGLNPQRDQNLSERLKKAIAELKDEDYRLTKEYISFFRALYPSEKTIVQLQNFLEQGVKKQFATGLSEIIASAKELDRISNFNQPLSKDDPLAELEALSYSEVEEQEKPVSQLEPPDPEEATMYDIW